MKINALAAFWEMQKAVLTRSKQAGEKLAPLAALLLLSIFVFGCTTPSQKSGQTGTTVDTTGSAQDQLPQETEISTLDSQLDEIETVINDTELEQMEFIDVEESAVQ